MPKKRTTNRDHACLVRFHGEETSPERIRKREQRPMMEDEIIAAQTVKCLLGLSYLWTGSLNGIQLQLWGTWLFYAVLVDLGDSVADEVSLPFDRISLEMIYRDLDHFYVAHHKGLTIDPIKYFAAPENRDLGVFKSIRKPFKKLIIDPFPDRVSREGSFFFEPSPQPCLTTALAP